MKKVVLFITACCTMLAVSAQDLITKIPVDASAVVTIKGKKLTDLVSLNDFSNTKVGKMLVEQLNKESKGEVTNLQDAGIDLNRNFYYFLDIKKGVFANCFLVPLNNAQNLMKLLGKSELENMVSENGISYIQNDYDGSVVMWTNNTLLFTIVDDKTIEDDYGYYDDFYNGSGEAVVIEEAIESDATDYEITVEEVEESPVKGAIEAVQNAQETEVEEESYEAQIARLDAERAAEQEKRDAERAIAREKREAERAIQRKELAKTTLVKAKQILAGNYANGSILRNVDYMKSVGKGGEEANAWIGDFGQIYQQAILPSSALFGGPNPYDFLDIDKIYGGMTMVAKLDFEEDNVALRTQYTVDEQMAGWYKQMYDGKFNSNFSKYLNEDRLLGYWSLNMSVEGMLKAYPGLIKSLFDSKEDNMYSDAVSIGADLFATLIDEEGVAEIMRGDALLALTDLSERTVTYTDYEYDEDYNRKEIEKSKTETVPDFILMLTSQQQKLYSRLVRIGLKEGELEAMNGIYKIKSMGASAPLDVYILFKDDMFIMGSSKRDMMAIASGSFVSKLSSSHKRNMKKNATSMYVNGKKIIAQIPTELYPSDLRGEIGFLTQNTEDVYFNFEKMKGNTMRGEMIWNTATTGHKNSFDYFLNMIDGLMPDAR